MTIIHRSWKCKINLRACFRFSIRYGQEWNCSFQSESIIIPLSLHNVPFFFCECQHSPMCLHYFNLTNWHWDFLQASVVCGQLCWAEMCRVMCGCVGEDVQYILSTEYSLVNSELEEELAISLTLPGKKWSLTYMYYSTFNYKCLHIFQLFPCSVFLNLVEQNEEILASAWNTLCDLSVPSSGGWEQLTEIIIEQTWRTFVCHFAKLISCVAQHTPDIKC